MLKFMCYPKCTAKVLVILSLFALLSACGRNSLGIIGGADGPTQILVGKEADFKIITPEKAKEIMESGEEHILLDVREEEEFSEGHIPGAVLLPHDEISATAEKLLPDKNAKILVYCRSGRRSKIAAKALAELGYTNVYEFGGIIDREYEIEK